MKKLKYFITLLCGFAASMLIFLVKDIFSQTEAVNVFHILCDGFFAVGVVDKDTFNLFVTGGVT